jgi:hypothetical protein
LIEAFLESFFHHSQALSSAYVLNLGLTHIENTFFRPSWFEAQPQEVLDYIQKKVWEGVGPVEYEQYCLIPSSKVITANLIERSLLRY